jgi:hypothetical protein
MTKGGQWRAEYVPGAPQTRVCVCDRPAVLHGDHGMCCKCGHRAEAERADPDSARLLASVLARLLEH